MLHQFNTMARKSGQDGKRRCPLVMESRGVPIVLRETIRSRMREVGAGSTVSFQDLWTEFLKAIEDNDFLSGRSTKLTNGETFANNRRLEWFFTENRFLRILEKGYRNDYRKAPKVEPFEVFGHDFSELNDQSRESVRRQMMAMGKDRAVRFATMMLESQQKREAAADGN